MSCDLTLGPWLTRDDCGPRCVRLTTFAVMGSNYHQLTLRRHELTCFPTEWVLRIISLCILVLIECFYTLFVYCRVYWIPCVVYCYTHLRLPWFILFLFECCFAHSVNYFKGFIAILPLFIYFRDCTAIHY